LKRPKGELSKSNAVRKMRTETGKWQHKTTWYEEEKVAMLGRPRLGDITKIQIRIRESKEFKVSRTSIML